jgi:hypothetical protein
MRVARETCPAATARQARVTSTPTTSPGEHCKSMFIGRQQTVQSSIIVKSPWEVSTLIVKLSPQWGHSTSVSTT